MYEELKMILELLGDLGAYAVWVAVAYFMFKLVTLASWILLIKYFITKVWEYAMAKKNTAVELQIDGNIITSDNTGSILLSTLLDIRKNSDYIHTSDVRWLRDAIREKKEKEKSL